MAMPPGRCWFWLSEKQTYYPVHENLTNVLRSSCEIWKNSWRRLETWIRGTNRFLDQNAKLTSCVNDAFEALSLGREITEVAPSVCEDRSLLNYTEGDVLEWAAMCTSWEEGWSQRPRGEKQKRRNGKKCEKEKRHRGRSVLHQVIRGKAHATGMFILPYHVPGTVSYQVQCFLQRSSIVQATL